MYNNIKQIKMLWLAWIVLNLCMDFFLSLRSLRVNEKTFLINSGKN
jgi:hypothetical protein